MNRRTRWLATTLGATAGSLALAAAIATMVPVHAQSAPPRAAASGLPAHQLTGYWQNFDNGATNLRLRDVPSEYDLIVVAFADADPARTGAVTFTLDPTLSSRLGGYSQADFKADIATLHSQGRKVIFSVGGERGNVPVPDQNAANAFASSAYGLMTSYGFDGVDIDLEAGLSPNPLASALRQLSEKAGKNLILTMAPQTIDFQTAASAYLQLIAQVKDILTVVHTQYYNSGTMLGCDDKVYSQGGIDFITAQACILLKTLRADQISLGLPASTRGAGSGYVSPSVVNDALSCLTQRTHCGAFTPATAAPGISGAMTWSINWDAANGYNFAKTVGPHLDTLPGGGGGPGPDPAPKPSDPAPSTKPSQGPPPPGGGCTAGAWSSATAYGGGTEVTYNEHLWRAKWWTQGDTPGSNAQSVWEDKGACGNAPPPPPPNPPPSNPPPSNPPPSNPPPSNPAPSTKPSQGPPPPGGGCSGTEWTAGDTYTGGTIVTYGRHSWKARWWTQNEKPGSGGEWSVWQDLGPC